MAEETITGTPQDTLLLLQSKLEQLVKEADAGKVSSDTFGLFDNMVSTALEEELGDEFPDIDVLLIELYEHFKSYDEKWASNVRFELRPETKIRLRRLSEKIESLLPPRPS